jgi:hypothetical protein
MAKADILNRRRARPRISLRTSLLVMTCIALAIVLWKTYRHVVAMRNEIQGLNNDLGYLTIDDPLSIYAMSPPDFGQLDWSWRIYLPPGRKYRLYCYSGNLPEKYGQTTNDWKRATDSMRAAGISSGKIPTMKAYWINEAKKRGQGGEVKLEKLQGEFSLHIQILQQDGQSVMQLQDDVRMPLSEPNGPWLTDQRAHSLYREVSNGSEEFPADEPVVLVNLRRAIVKPLTNADGTVSGYASESQPGDADTVLLWIEPDDRTVDPTAEE